MRATMARNLANRYGSVLLFSPRLGRLGRVATWGTDFVRLRVTVSRLLWRSRVLCCVHLRVCFYRQGEWGSVSSRRLPPPWFLVKQFVNINRALSEGCNRKCVCGKHSAYGPTRLT